MMWLLFGPTPVSTAGMTIDLTNVAIAVITVSGVWGTATAMVRKARIEAGPAAATNDTTRDEMTWNQWKLLVQELRADTTAAKEDARTARVEARDAREGEAECNRRHDELRVEFDKHRRDSEARIRELEEHARMVPILRDVIASTALDVDQRAQVLAAHPDTVQLLNGDDDGESREPDPE